MKNLRITSLLVFLCASLLLAAQPAERLVNVQVTLDRADWLYHVGEKVTFGVSAFRSNVPLDNVELRYELSEDMMKPYKTGTVTLKNGRAEIETTTLKQPGFLRCRAFVKHGGYDYEGMATAGFEPQKLKPVTTLPQDFTQFWAANREEALRIDLQPTMTLLPERCTDKVNVYHISYQNNNYGSFMYGILCVPKAAGKYPAILKVPGAGVRPYGGEVERASKGVIILEIGIHGIPVTMSTDIYNNLSSGPLRDYSAINLDNRDQYYYKRVYMGCVRAIDFIETLPQYNGKLATFGGSQGGALSIVVAGLDSRVKGLVAFYPAMTDMAGYTQKRAGGWPHMFRNEANCTPEKLKTAQYYDVVNFARQLKAPGFYTFGYNDMMCPPTTSWSVYNIVTAPKEMMVSENTGHYAYPEQWDAVWKWVMDVLK